MPAAVAVPAAISAGTSILGGVLGSRAAGKAADLQAKANEQAAEELRKVLAQYNPQIGAAASTAGTEAKAAGTAAATGVTDAAAAGGAAATTAAGTANDFLAPYRDIGTNAADSLRALMVPGGDLNRTFTAADMAAYDPGYQFRIDQANKALQGTAAAKGGALGGGMIGAVAGLNQNLAAGEFQNAFARFTQEGQDRYSRLAQLLGIGQTAATTSGGNLINAAQFGGNLGLTAANEAGGFGVGTTEYAGTANLSAAEQEALNALNTQHSLSDLMTGAAQARAAGIVGGTNAWTGAIGGVANAAQGVGKYYQDQTTLDSLRGIFANPALRPAAAINV
jgi:hypothetical protein